MSHSREPVPHTCPQINSLLSDIDDMKRTLGDMVASLEYLRECNDKLRDWGTAEAERVDKLEDELDKLT